MDQLAPAAPNPYRDGLPPAPPGPPEGEQHAFLGGSTVPFLEGLAAGAAAPLGVVIALLAGGFGPAAAGAAGVAAALLGALALGAQRWLAALGAAERFAAERAREEAETHEYPERERWEVAAVLHRYGLRGEALGRAVEAVAADRRRWVDFMLRFELDLLEPRPAFAARDGMALAGGAALAGLLPALAALLGGWGWLGASAAAAGGLLAGGWLHGRAAGHVAIRGAARAALLGLGAGLAGFVLGWFALRLATLG